MPCHADRTLSVDDSLIRRLVHVRDASTDKTWKHCCACCAPHLSNTLKACQGVRNCCFTPLSAALCSRRWVLVLFPTCDRITVRDMFDSSLEVQTSFSTFNCDRSRDRDISDPVCSDDGTVCHQRRYLRGDLPGGLHGSTGAHFHSRAKAFSDQQRKSVGVRIRNCGADWLRVTDCLFQ